MTEVSLPTACVSVCIFFKGIYFQGIYMVFLQGRRAIYCGQDGAFHIERFPDGAP